MRGRRHVVQVRPGGCILRDGAVLETQSAMDKSPVTGKSVLVARGLGEMVVAAVINTATLLRVRVAAAASDNPSDRIAQMYEGHGFPCAHAALHRAVQPL